MEQKRLNIPREVPCAVQQWQGLIAINYAARAKGISRHMRVQEAKAKCPELQCIHVQTIGPHASPHQCLISKQCGTNCSTSLPVADETGGTEEDTKDRTKQKACLERYRRACWEILAVLHTAAPQACLLAYPHAPARYPSALGLNWGRAWLAHKFQHV